MAGGPKDGACKRERQRLQSEITKHTSLFKLKVYFYTIPYVHITIMPIQNKINVAQTTKKNSYIFMPSKINKTVKKVEGQPNVLSLLRLLISVEDQKL